MTPNMDHSEDSTGQVRPSRRENFDRIAAASEAEDLLAPSQQRRSRGLFRTGLVHGLSTETWLWELSAIFLSLMTNLAICGVLLAYDGSPVPQLPFDITLNTIISALGTFSKATLVFGMAAAISQAKWLWFINKDQRLQDLQTFDDASRGPIGSLTMMFQRSTSVTARIIASILLLSVATDPFLQQLISYPTRQWAEDFPFASIQEASAEVNSPGNFTQLPALNDSFLAAIESGIYDTSPQAPLPPVCSTGNCDWKPYNAFAFCSSCHDITSDVKVTSGMPFRSFYDIHAKEILENWNKSYVDELTKNGGFYDLGATIAASNGSLQVLYPYKRLWQAFQRPFETTSNDTWSLAHPFDQLAANQNYTYQLIPYQVENNNILPLTSMVQNVYSLFTWEVSNVFEIASITSWAQFSNVSLTPVAGISNPLVGISAITLNPNATDAAQSVDSVVECAIQPCINTYDVHVRAGKLESSIVASDYGNIMFTGSLINPYKDVIWKAHVNGTDYAIGQDELYFISESLTSAISGRVVSQSSPNGAFGEDRAGVYRFTFKDDGQFDQITGFERVIVAESDDTTADAMAGSTTISQVRAIYMQGNLSQSLENVVASLNHHLQQYGHEQKRGDVLFTQTYVRVRWAWLILPVLLALLGLVGLLLTMWQSRKMWKSRQGRTVLWKASSLPLLYRGPVSGGSAMSTTVKGNTVADMSEVSKDLRVGLVRDDSGDWRLRKRMD